MGFLSRLFKTDTQIVTQPAPLPSSNAAAHMELLDRLARGYNPDGLAQQFTASVGPVDRVISQFVMAGLLRPATITEKLDHKYRLVDLKAISREYNGRTSGKKADVAAEVARVVPEFELKQLIGDIILYRATPEGEQCIEAYRADKERKKAAMLVEAAEALRRGDARQAGQAVAQYEAQQVFSRGMNIDWSQGMDDRTVSVAVYLINHPYDDLHIPQEQRREVGVQLALTELLGEDIRDASSRLEQIAGGTFSCGPLEEFLSHKPCGYLPAEASPDSPQDQAFLYAHTRMFEASNLVDLTRFMAHRQYTKGIEILNTPEDRCAICNRGRKKYRWSEVDSLPKLPRHWGCRCLYVAWV